MSRMALSAGLPRPRPARSRWPPRQLRHLKVTSRPLVTVRVTTEKYAWNSRMGHMPCRNT